jgi:hypothetical protein
MKALELISQRIYPNANSEEGLIRLVEEKILQLDQKNQ